MSEYRQSSGHHADAGDNRGADTMPRRGGVSGQESARGRGKRWRIAVLCILLLAGCTADAPDPDPAPVVDTVQAPAPTDNAVEAAASPPSEEAVASPPSDEVQAEPAAVGGAAWTAGDTRESRTVTGAALLRDIRTARHQGFDRIVFDFGTDDVPSYAISYIDRPVRQCGSGDTVPLAGDAWLSVVVQPANAHTEEGAATVRERERAPGLPALLELKMTCDFEAMVEVVAGVTAPGPYRAFVLREPSRLVVDIAHGGRE